MKIELSPEQAARIKSALVVASADAVLAWSRFEGPEQKRVLAEVQYIQAAAARDIFKEAVEAAAAADQSFAPYQIVAVDDAGGPEGGKLMYYVQDENGERVSAKLFDYNEVAAMAQAKANIRRREGGAVAAVYSSAPERFAA